MGWSRSWTRPDGYGSAATVSGSNQSVAAAIFQPITGEPYQAENIPRSMERLFNGTVITQESKGMIARDKEGRTREEFYIVHSGQVNGKQLDLTLDSASVGDSVSHSMLIWNNRLCKIAMRMQLPSLLDYGSPCARDCSRACAAWNWLGDE